VAANDPVCSAPLAHSDSSEVHAGSFGGETQVQRNAAERLYSAV